MSRVEIPTRLGPTTNESLQADIPVFRRIISGRCADLETAVRSMAGLVTARASTEPILGYHGVRTYPEPVDRVALAAVRDEALRDTQVRLTALQDLIAELLGAS